MPMIRKKRPCCICRRWFLPDKRVKERQVTCGDPKCQREQHKKQCSKWNRKNSEYFKSNYLQKKLEKAAKNKPACKPGKLSEDSQSRQPTPLFRDLSTQFTCEINSDTFYIIIDYVIQAKLFRFQKGLMQKMVNNKGSPSL